MRTSLIKVSLLALAALFALLQLLERTPDLSAHAQTAAQSADESLAREALALIQAKCLECHGADAMSGLDLRTRASMLKGGNRGPAIDPGRSASSRLYQMIAGELQPAMPLGARLTASEIDLLRRWIDRGAPWPANAPLAPPASSASSASGANQQRRSEYWAFRPPRRPEVPRVRRSAWVKNPIDAFILARLEERGLEPSPEADKRTLLRRLTFDLTGLPPTPEEIDAFLADASPDAYEKVVRRLLASPRYGERWAQHWLDVVRFAETNGFELDQDREGAWRYRDWVIRALNDDKPYDRFILEQIAGDELAPDDFSMRVATGMLRAGPQHVVAGNQDLAVNRQEWLTEAVNGVGNAVLGLTIGCARCHDHKFDPIPQADYYRLQAFFAATDNDDYKNPTKEEVEAYEAAKKAHEARLKPIKDEIAAIEKPYRERLKADKRAKLEPKYVAALAVEEKKRTMEEKRLAMEAMSMLEVKWDELVASLGPEDRDRRAALRRKMHEIDLYAPQPLPVALSVSDKISPVPPTHIFKGGDPHSPLAEVEPQFPGALSSVAGKAEPAELPANVKSTGRRLALARWLVRPDHPLTPRVIVNRLWHHHFGRGIVSTPNDFGRNGGQPTHPELLDYLATELVARGWSLKRMHELIVLSNAYRQASANDAMKAKADPDNLLLWRQNRQRLDGEALRDAILAVAGNLTEEVGGLPVRVPLEPEVYDTIFTEHEPDNLWPVTPDAKQHTRRTLYLLRKRNVRLPMLVAFDSPDWMSSCAARATSVHALQALTLLNSDFLFEQSRVLARRLIEETGGKQEAMIGRLYELALGRPPRAVERRLARDFLRRQTAIISARARRGEPIAAIDNLSVRMAPAEVAAWVDLSLATFNLNEFLYLK